MNPKEAAGAEKIPLHLFPTTAVLYGALGMLEGQLKYGRSNFRASSVFASTYYAAAKRHLDLWFEGENCDPQSKVPHLANALSCIAILIDAECNTSLIDDRAYARVDGYRSAVNQLTPLVEHLKNLHKDKKPKNFDARDNPDKPQCPKEPDTRDLPSVNSGWVLSLTGRYQYKFFGAMEKGDCLADLSEFKDMTKIGGHFEGDRQTVILALLRDGTAQIRQAKYIEWMQVLYWRPA